MEDSPNETIRRLRGTAQKGIGKEHPFNEGYFLGLIFLL